MNRREVIIGAGLTAGLALACPSLAHGVTPLSEMIPAGVPKPTDDFKRIRLRASLAQLFLRGPDGKRLNAALAGEGFYGALHTEHRRGQAERHRQFLESLPEEFPTNMGFLGPVGPTDRMDSAAPAVGEAGFIDYGDAGFVGGRPAGAPPFDLTPFMSGEPPTEEEMRVQVARAMKAVESLPKRRPDALGLFQAPDLATAERDAARMEACLWAQLTGDERDCPPPPDGATPEQIAAEQTRTLEIVVSELENGVDRRVELNHVYETGDISDWLGVYRALPKGRLAVLLFPPSMRFYNALMLPDRAHAWVPVDELPPTVMTFGGTAEQLDELRAKFQQQSPGEVVVASQHPLSRVGVSHQCARCKLYTELAEPSVFGCPGGIPDDRLCPKCKAGELTMHLMSDVCDACGHEEPLSSTSFSIA